MDSPGSNSDPLRLKFLCSFNGSILPRPQDGKLRYVGGETRIVSVQRDIGFEELMAKMKELFEEASVLKYQQPDEDLDALVSVVNDDDVTNMMEEYEKLGSGDGFTRLRIFLFSSIEQDESIHFVERDERDNERRYVDALNSHNESPEIGKQQIGEELIEQYYNQMNLDSNIHNLQHVRIPHQQALNQRYNDMESPWSPAYYSPRHHVNDFPNSPSSSRYHSPYGEPDTRVPPEDYFRPPENVVWLSPSPVTGEKAGFPGNILHNSGENHRSPVLRNEVPDLANLGNGFHPYDPRSLYNETHNDRGWMMHHSNPRVEDQRSHNPVSGRFNDHYVVDNNGMNMNMNVGHNAYSDGNNHLPPHYVHGNYSNNYGAENLYHGSPHGHVAPNAFWRNGQGQGQSQSQPQQENGTSNLAYVRTTRATSPRVPVGIENQNSWVDSSPKVHFTPDPVQFTHDPVQYTPDPGQFTHDPVHFTPDPVHFTPDPVQFTPDPVQFTPENVQITPELPNCSISIDQVIKSDPLLALVDEIVPPTNTLTTEAINKSIGKKSLNKLEEKAAEIIGDEISHQENTPVLKCKELEVESVKKAELESGEEVKIEDKKDSVKVKEEIVQELDAVDAPADLELDSDSDNQNAKIEPTKAEEEAISRGLQTIRNDDLEEIRELGSGTYGAVYHGKWKGSDVAIKRIKASCFAGRPSERERLIADFWKEALILSSLHHPNVVSFYGIVRDGPDGSLATVTEFMVNGSLKQFLQKKDRTIDRRKRLIIAMDAAFGMEYLHGKNIVHFDLKCENLLVNMRDPHRPICKIGDLGLSKVKQHTLVSGGVRGTLPWMAPELLSGKSHMVSEKIDVYSFGIVMWELLTGDEPYGDLHCASIIGGIVNNSLRPTIPTWCDPEWKALMGTCWSADPSERPSFSEISQKLRTMAAAINVK